MTPRTQQKAQTRERLKQAAQARFAEVGYAQTAIADITRNAGVALGTFYVHFTDKEALLDELLHEFNGRLVTRLTAALAAQPATLDAAVRVVAEHFLDHWSENREFVRAYSQRAAAGIAWDALREGVNPEMTAFLSARLKALAGAGGADERRLGLALQGLLALWLRVGMQFLFSPDYPRALVVDTLVGATVGALTHILGAPHGSHAANPAR